MAILDAQHQLSNAQAITGDAVSTNSYDIGSGAKDIGTGKPIHVIVVIDEAFDNLTSLAFELISSASSNLSSPTTVATLGTALLAGLTAGARIDLGPLPSGISQRYVGLNYNVTGTNPSTGKVTAFLSPMGKERNVPTSDD